MARRVLVAEFMHETNTFSVQLTDEQAFRNSSYYIDDDIRPAFEGTRTSLGAAFEAARRFEWQVVHPLAASANPSGRVTDACFEASVEPHPGRLRRSGWRLATPSWLYVHAEPR